MLEWIFTNFLTFQTYSKKGWVETLSPSFLLITFLKKYLLQNILETFQKVGKIMDIHFFENVAFEKKLPVHCMQ
jgi:hypothetical protein